MTTYIVVADAARARIFTRDALHLAEQESLVHAAGRLHEGDLITDRRGADVHESTSTSSRSSGEGFELNGQAYLSRSAPAELERWAGSAT